MITRENIVAKINELQSVYTGQGSVDTLFTPVTETVAAYFTQDKAALTHDIQYTINQLILDLTNRHTVYEHQELLPTLPTNYPAGYDDVRDVFTANGVLEEILSIDAAAFNNAYTYNSTGTQQTPISNHYLTTWQKNIAAARSSELSALSAIASFCESGSYNAGLAMFFESLGRIVSAMSSAEIAKRIYISGGYKEIIERFGLDVHIASAVKGT